MLTAKFVRPNAGYPYDQEQTSKHLVEGWEYEVEDIMMGQSHTNVFLKGFSCPFNSVAFDFFRDGVPHDIYRDPKINPYIGFKMKRSTFEQ